MHLAVCLHGLSAAAVKLLTDLLPDWAQKRRKPDVNPPKAIQLRFACVLGGEWWRSATGNALPSKVTKRYGRMHLVQHQRTYVSLSL